jgi:hypothetical protein
MLCNLVKRLNCLLETSKGSLDFSECPLGLRKVIDGTCELNLDKSNIELEVNLLRRYFKSLEWIAISMC